MGKCRLEIGDILMQVQGGGSGGKSVVISIMDGGVTICRKHILDSPQVAMGKSEDFYEFYKWDTIIARYRILNEIRRYRPGTYCIKGAV